MSTKMEYKSIIRYVGWIGNPPSKVNYQSTLRHTLPHHIQGAQRSEAAFCPGFVPDVKAIITIGIHTLVGQVLGGTSEIPQW